MRRNRAKRPGEMAQAEMRSFVVIARDPGSDGGRRVLETESRRCQTHSRLNVL